MYVGKGLLSNLIKDLAARAQAVGLTKLVEYNRKKVEEVHLQVGARHYLPSLPVHAGPQEGCLLPCFA